MTTIVFKTYEEFLAYKNAKMKETEFGQELISKYPFEYVFSDSLTLMRFHNQIREQMTLDQYKGLRNIMYFDSQESLEKAKKIIERP